MSLITDRNKLESGTVTMVLRRNGESDEWPLAIDTPRGSFTLSDSAGKEIEKGAAVDQAVIERWYKAAKIKTDEAVVRRGMDDVLKLAARVAKDPGSLKTSNQNNGRPEIGSLRANGGGGGTRDYLPSLTPPAPPPARPTGPEGNELLVFGAGLFVAYLAGAYAIVWRHRRLVRIDDAAA